MAPSSVHYKSLPRRQEPFEPPNPPNDTPNWIPIIVPQTGGESAATAASIIVPLTVIPGVLLMVLGLWLIYWLYKRNLDRPVHRGERDRERRPNTASSSRRNKQSPEHGHEMDDRGGSGHVPRSGRNGGRGEITQPQHPTNEITSSTESVCGTDRGHAQDTVAHPSGAGRRGRPNTPARPAPPTPVPPSPQPVIQKRRSRGDNFRDDRNGRGSLETLHHSRSRSRSSAVAQNRGDVWANYSDDRRGRDPIEVVLPSTSRSDTRIRTEPSQNVSVMTSDTEDSSDTIKPGHTSHHGSTSGSRHSDNGYSRSSDTSGQTYPSVSSEARYDSSYITASSSFPDGSGPSASPTNITSLVSSLQSDGTHHWQDALRIHSPFGEMPRIPGNFPSDIAFSRDNGNNLPSGFHA